MAFSGDKSMNDYLHVRVNETPYTREWQLYGQTTYRMGASKVIKALNSFSKNYFNGFNILVIRIIFSKQGIILE